MRLSQLADEPRSPDPVIAGLTADSREVKQDFLFAALEGITADGADFIPQAEKRGAAAVLARPGVRAQVPLVVDPEPRRRLACMAARFYPAQPDVIAGITGTNGKTSTAQFVAQLWERLGRSSGSIGTLGALAKNFEAPLTHTTPEPVVLHQTLHSMAKAGVTHLAMEVSSHALAQFRADGVRFNIAAFTNITQDHLDFHSDFDDYSAAKQRLFKNLLDDAGVAVVNADGAGADAVIDIAKNRNIRLVTTGVHGAELKLDKTTPHPGGLSIQVSVDRKTFELGLPLVGAFQAENALLAAGIVIAAGERAEETLPLLEALSSVPGRMELAARIGAAAVYVDYAHTPDAVATALKALRPHVDGRLIAIIGAGGDRDKAKRPLMGSAAEEDADIVIVTDDNPRTENPAEIRKQILKGAPNAKEIGDRGEAITAGIGMLDDGDVLLIAGKGHETGQMVGTKRLPFNDVAFAKAAAEARRREVGI